MTDQLYAELEKTFFRYKAALRAEVPNLLEVRAYGDKLLKQWTHFERTWYYGIEVKTREPARFEVIHGEQASPTEGRGPSSPLKDPEIAELESLAKDLFGESVECSTAWRLASPVIEQRGSSPDLPASSDGRQVGPEGRHQ